MNNLKTARRSSMRKELLRSLVTICSLGEAWEDPSQISVEEIVELWRSESRKGRYESAMWRASGLVEPKGAVPSRSPGPSGAEEEMGADNTTAGGMFGWLGRDAGES